MSSRENSVTSLIAQYLRNNGINANTFESLEIPGQGVKEPDYTIRNGGTFHGEAKWEGEYNKGIVEATDYRQAPTSNGTFAIAYPEELKREMAQDRLTSDVESILGGYEFSVTFLHKNRSADMRRIRLNEIPDWLKSHITGDVEPQTEVDEVVTVLRQTAEALTQEADLEVMDLFENVLGVGVGDIDEVKTAKRVTGYLLVNQIMFYRVLSAKTDFKDIDADELNSPEDLIDYFDSVLEVDYTPIFYYQVANAYGQEHLPLIKDTIKSIYALNPDQVHHEVLGDIFHKLIPFTIRKNIAAYYTQQKTANILANLAVEDGGVEVLDPACGSGNLLTAAYREKKRNTNGFGEKDHRQFLEEDITGVDIMPFAAHLSTIHLALQQPQYESDKVRVGIDDSTKLSPGDEIQPLSYLLPDTLTQRTLGNFDKSIEDFAEDERIERGAISRKGMEQAPIKLNEVDLVIMNPPYSRQETIANFGEEYKTKLTENRFRHYENHLHGQMNFYAYFFLLADRFLKKGGKVAAVVSAGLLNIQTDEGIRELLLKRFDIEDIVIRDDASHFSEDTDRREILIVAKKGGSEQVGTNFIRVNSLDVDSNEILNICRNLDKGQKGEGRDFTVHKVDLDSLNKNNLFAPFAIRNDKLIEVWENVVSSNKLVSLDSLDAGIIGGARGGGYDARDYHPEMSINEKNAYGLMNKDVWELVNETPETVTARHRFTEDEFAISKDKVVPNVRRFSGRWKADLTDLEEYVLLERIDDFDKWESQTEQDNIPVEEWKSRMDNRMSHIAIARRANISADGTAHLSYYSEKRRLWPDTMWLLTNMNSGEAKLLTAWFDSSFGWFQFLLDRIETEGAYAEWHNYIIDEFRVLNPSRLSERERGMLIDAIEEYANLEVGSIPQQLAALSDPGNLTKDELDELNEVFGDLSFGSGLEERRKLDKTIMDIMDVSKEDQDEYLEILYPLMLKEISTLKQMM